MRSLYCEAEGVTRYKYTLRKIYRRTEGPFKEGKIKVLSFLDTLRVLFFLRSLYINLVCLRQTIPTVRLSDKLKTKLRRVYIFGIRDLETYFFLTTAQFLFWRYEKYAPIFQ